MSVIQRRVLHPCCEAEWQHNTVIKGKKEAWVFYTLYSVTTSNAKKRLIHQATLNFYCSSQSEMKVSEWMILGANWLAGICQPNFGNGFVSEEIKITLRLLFFNLVKNIHLKITGRVDFEPLHFFFSFLLFYFFPPPVSTTFFQVSIGAEVYKSVGDSCKELDSVFHKFKKPLKRILFSLNFSTYFNW